MRQLTKSITRILSEQKSIARILSEMLWQDVNNRVTPKQEAATTLIAKNASALLCTLMTIALAQQSQV
jgi:hypothetical protein